MRTYKSLSAEKERTGKNIFKTQKKHKTKKQKTKKENQSKKVI